MGKQKNKQGTKKGKPTPSSVGPPRQSSDNSIPENDESQVLSGPKTEKKGGGTRRCSIAHDEDCVKLPPDWWKNHPKINLKDRLATATQCVKFVWGATCIDAGEIIPHLLHDGERFYVWGGQMWGKIADATVRSKVYTFMGKATHPAKRHRVVCEPLIGESNLWMFYPPTPFGKGPTSDAYFVEWEGVHPNKTGVDAVVDALKAIGHIEDDPPIWLDGREESATEFVAFENGLLDVGAWCKGETRLLASTPAYFNLVGMRPYDFDPNAESKVFKDYLEQVFNGDGASIRLALEWFGYNMVHDVSLEKFMLLVGGPRSGKGTFVEALTSAIGEEQMAEINFSKFKNDFALQPLFDKLAVIMPDAHLPKDPETALIALEQLKSISGGDRLSVNRKHRDALPYERISARITVGVNNLPDFPDEAGAIMPRLLLLIFPNKYEGAALDDTLKAKMRGEGQGIGMMALRALRRLRKEQGNRFTEPTVGAGVKEKFRLQTGKMAAFVTDCCELNANAWTVKDEVIACYNVWAEEKGVGGIVEAYRGPFTSNLTKACPSILSTKKQVQGIRVPVYVGIRLKKRMASDGSPATAKVSGVSGV